MKFSLWSAIAVACMATPFGLAQTEATRLAAYESLDLPTSGSRVVFNRRAASEGDRIDQQLSVSLNLESTVRKGHQTIKTSTGTIGRVQRRTMIAEEVVQGKTVAAQVRFAEYQRTKDNETTSQPVVGKTYLCRREADDSLTVIRDDGSFTSPDEFAIVSESMQSLGRANPLVDFLAGRTIAIGEQLEVPLEIGEELLSSDGALGRVSKFHLQLSSVDPTTRVATFALDMESQGAETTQMRLSVIGQLLLEVDTCRTRRLTLQGPMAMATTIGSYSAAETTFVRGKLKMDMSASYAD